MITICTLNFRKKKLKIKMVMLKNIPKIMSPELLSVLARMGHGDEIVLADANFPSAATAKAGPELVGIIILTIKIKINKCLRIIHGCV